MWVFVLIVGVALGMILAVLLRQRQCTQKLAALRYKLSQARIALQKSIIKYKETINATRHK